MPVVGVELEMLETQECQQIANCMTNLLLETANARLKSLKEIFYLLLRTPSFVCPIEKTRTRFFVFYFFEPVKTGQDSTVRYGRVRFL